jgi:predicted Zn-dependent protease with MMP-like domain
MIQTIQVDSQPCCISGTHPLRTRYGHRVEPVGPTFEELVQDALDALPDDIRAQLSNMAVVTQDEPPRGMPLLGLYEGIPLTRRTTNYSGVLPDKITIFRGPLERLYGADPAVLRREVKRVVLHEVAHHFGISDERLVEIDRY